MIIKGCVNLQYINQLQSNTSVTNTWGDHDIWRLHWQGWHPFSWKRATRQHKDNTICICFVYTYREKMMTTPPKTRHCNGILYKESQRHNHKDTRVPQKSGILLMWTLKFIETRGRAESDSPFQDIMVDLERCTFLPKPYPPQKLWPPKTLQQPCK